MTLLNGSTKSSIETPPRAPSPVHNFGTLAVHAGSPHDPTTGAVIESVSGPGQNFADQLVDPVRFLFRPPSLKPVSASLLAHMNTAEARILIGIASAAIPKSVL